jgi:hypothetical protein
MKPSAYGAGAAVYCEDRDNGLVREVFGALDELGRLRPRECGWQCLADEFWVRGIDESLRAA